MDRETFTQNLYSHWPKIAKGAVSSLEKKLGFYSERDINDIWNILRDTYTKTTAPNYADILNIIKDNDIQQARGEKHKRHYVYVCLDCGEVYADKQEPLVAVCCPVCMSEHRKVEEYDGAIHQVTTYQYQCFMSENDKVNKNYLPAKCVMYGQSGAYGPMCKAWGKKQTEAECRSCECYKCCSNERKQNIAEVERINKHKEDIESKYHV